MKTILKSLIVTASIYLIVYIFGLVYQFHFYNPFAWIMDIPKWSGGERITLFLIIIFYKTGNIIALSPSIQGEIKNEGRYMFPIIFWLCAICLVGGLVCNLQTT